MKTKYLIAAMILTLPSSFCIASDGEDLFDNLAGDKSSIKNSSVGSYEPLLVDPSAPKSGSSEDYVNWVNNKIELSKKNWMAFLARKVVFPNKNRCLWHKDAFIDFTKKSTDPVLGDKYKVTCFAGPNEKSITNVNQFEMNVKLNPDPCAKPEDMKKFFDQAGNRSQSASTAYAYGIINSSCRLSVLFASQVTLANSKSISPEKLVSELNKPRYKDLRGVVKRSTQTKEEESIINPFRLTNPGGGGGDAREAQ